MTDNEIKKALCNCYLPNNAVICRYINLGGEFNAEIESISEITIADIVDLINRQKAENENYKQIAENQQSVSMDKEVEIKRLKAEVERLCAEVDELIISKDLLFDEAEALIRKSKAEAVKEFAERLCEGRVSNDPVVIAVKVELEMVGEDK